MVWIPFSGELDDLFQQDRRIWLKVLGGGFVGAIASLGGLRRLPEKDLAPVVVACLVTVFTIGGAGAVLALSLKDIVRRRIDDGKPVNVVLRAYLAGGVWSLLLWFITVLVGTLIVTLAVLSL
jgi:hypothetical protein